MYSGCWNKIIFYYILVSQCAFLSDYLCVYQHSIVLHFLIVNKTTPFTTWILRGGFYFELHLSLLVLHRVNQTR